MSLTSKAENSMDRKDGTMAESHDVGRGEVIIINDGAVQSPAIQETMGWFAILAAGYNLTGGWVVCAATMGVSLVYGPATTLWGLIASMIIYSFIGLTIAELVATYPTVGGQYHWVSILSPESYRKPLSFITGFVSWFSWICMSGSSVGATMLAIFSCVAHYYPDFVVQTWMNFLVFEAINVMLLLINVFAINQVPKIYDFGFYLSIGSFFIITITCLARADVKQSSETVWTSTSSTSGWSTGVQFLIALAPSSLIFAPIDGSAHLVDDVKDARRVIPQTILSGLAISYLSVFVFAVSMLYCVQDIDYALSSSIGLPIFEIWKQATNSTTAAITFLIVFVILVPFGSVACFQVTSRMTWSFARDHGLLFSNQLGSVHAKLGSPVWASVLNFGILTIIGILYLASPLAYNTIVGVASILQAVTLSLPSVLMIYNRRSASVLPKDRTLKINNVLGWVANIVTVLFAIIASVFFLFPSTEPFTSKTMNYGIAVIGGILLLAAVNWAFYARKHYNGPRFELRD